MFMEDFSLRSHGSFSIVSNLLSRNESLDDIMFWEKLKAEWLNTSNEMILNYTLLPFFDDDFDLSPSQKSDHDMIRQMLKHWLDLANRNSDLSNISSGDYTFLYLDSFMASENFTEFLMAESSRQQETSKVSVVSLKQSSLRRQAPASLPRRSSSQPDLSTASMATSPDLLALEFLTYLTSLDINLCCYLLLEGPKTLPSRFKALYKNLVAILCKVHTSFLPAIMQIKKGGVYRPLDYDGSWSPDACCGVCLQAVGAFTNRCCDVAVCEMCLTEYVNHQVGQLGHVHIECPSLGCSSPMRCQQVWLRLSEANRARYELIKNNLLQTDTKKLCPHCMQFYELSEDEATQLRKKHANKVYKRGFNVTCVICQSRWCFKCQTPIHQTLSCKKNLSADKQLMKWAKASNDVAFLDTRNARRCPKCDVLVERNGGCPHMECTRCGCSWCYDCGRRRLKVNHVPFMNHDSRLFILGCSKTFMPNSPHLRRLARVSVLSGLVLGLSVVAVPAAAVLIGAAALVGLPAGAVLLLRSHGRSCCRRIKDQ